MPYNPTELDVACTLQVIKRSGGSVVAGYPKEYSVLAAFGSYDAITIDQWQRMEQPPRDARLNAFITYINSIEGINVVASATNEPYRDSVVPQYRTITYSIPEATPNVVIRQFETGATAVIESPAQLGMVLPSGDTFDGWVSGSTTYAVGQVVTMNTNLVLSGSTSEVPSGDTLATLAAGTNIRGKILRVTNINKPLNVAQGNGGIIRVLTFTGISGSETVLMYNMYAASGSMSAACMYLFNDQTSGRELLQYFLFKAGTEPASALTQSIQPYPAWDGWNPNTLEFQIPNDKDYIVSGNSFLGDTADTYWNGSDVQII